MPVKPRVWKRLDSYSALMVDYHNAIAAVFWNLGPECCWIVFNEPRPAGTCLRGLLATETKASGSVYAKSHKSPDWDTAAEEARRSEEHTSELQSLMRISYAVFCLKKKIMPNQLITSHITN